jgi:hypothetical protein
MCDLEMIFFCISQLYLTPQRVGSQPGLAIINSDPGAIRVKCLAQRHIVIFFTLSARGFKLTNLSVTGPSPLLLGTCSPNRIQCNTVTYNHIHEG